MSFATFLPFHAAISKYMKRILNFKMVQSSYKILPNQNNFRLNQYQRWDFVTTCIFIFQALHIYEMNKDWLQYKSAKSSSSQPSSLSFRFQKSQNVSLSDRSLNVTDDLSVLFADEFDFDLGTLALAAGSTKNLDDTCLNDLLVHPDYSIRFSREA